MGFEDVSNGLNRWRGSDSRTWTPRARRDAEGTNGTERLATSRLVRQMPGTRSRFPRTATLACLLVACVTATSLPATAKPSAAAPAPSGIQVDPSRQPTARSGTPSGNAIDEDDRDAVLPDGWEVSADRAWTTVGDAGGLHLLVADAATGYAWGTVATLREPDVDADAWIGQACLTASEKRAVVVYAPRGITNDPSALDTSAYAAVIDLVTGGVTKLAERVSVAYFNPGCGADETAVLTRGPGSGTEGRTDLLAVDAVTSQVTASVTVEGQVTSAVPTGEAVTAARGASIITIDGRGNLGPVTPTSSTPFRLVAGDEGVTFLEKVGETEVVARHAERGAVRDLAPGRLGSLRSMRSGSGTFLVGDGEVIEDLPPGLRRVQTPITGHLKISTDGALAVTAAAPSAPTGDGSTSADEPGGGPLSLEATVLGTDREVEFEVEAEGLDRTAAAEGEESAPNPDPADSLSAAEQPTGTGLNRSTSTTSTTTTNPVDSGYTCAVPRNDPNSQVHQPTPLQVEWATNLAVEGTLTAQRPANWKNSGLPAYSPQSMFPPLPLAGGGRVPAQIMLGILAQESNLWQASYHVAEGVSGNPLVGNFYGGAFPAINFASADCGYGVAQVTDGMRRSSTLRTATQKRAIALDYSANIAAGLRILQEKWNQTYNAGMRIHSADPSELENWFFAIWAYNSGFYPDRGDGRPWGVGWLNNPVNPRYPADRAPFLSISYADAARPNLWPYPELVLGWAAYPISKSSGPGYRQASGQCRTYRPAASRTTATRPAATNECDPDGRFPNNADSTRRTRWVPAPVPTCCATTILLPNGSRTLSGRAASRTGASPPGRQNRPTGPGSHLGARPPDCQPRRSSSTMCRPRCQRCAAASRS